MMHEPTQNQLREFLEHFSYREGWRFALSYEFHHPVPVVLAACTTADVRTGRETVITLARPIPYMLPDNWRDRFVYELWHLIEQLESHERLEWFKFDGKWVWPPHTNGVSHHTPGGPRFG